MTNGNTSRYLSDLITSTPFETHQSDQTQNCQNFIMWSSIDVASFLETFEFPEFCRVFCRLKSPAKFYGVKSQENNKFRRKNRKGDLVVHLTERFVLVHRSVQPAQELQPAARRHCAGSRGRWSGGARAKSCSKMFALGISARS